LQLAYDGITYCCEALNEGKVAVKKIKQATEDAKTIVQDTKSIWGFFTGLFGKPKFTPTTEAKPVEKKKTTYTTHIPNEQEIVQQFIGLLGDFFRNN